MTADVMARVQPDRARKVVLVDLHVDDPSSPNITLELIPEKARALADSIHRAADAADGLVAEG